jgi:hypothetical protein
MGAKPAFKRYKNRVYIAGCIVISLFLSGCQHAVQYRSTPNVIDQKEKKYLKAVLELIFNKDFKAAAVENQRILDGYSDLSDMNDMVSANYVQTAEIISELLTRIMEDEYRERTLSMQIVSCEEQIKVLRLSSGSFKKKAAALEKKIADMDRLAEKAIALEKEKALLQQQINQLKEIDLNPDPVGSNQTAE